MKIYISGKITGLSLVVAEMNFEKVEKIILDLGHEPINPMKIIPYDPKLTWEDYMIGDIKALFECQAIFMQENWAESKGARIERSIAFEMGLIIKHLPLNKGFYNEFN